ncbi:MAG: glycosyltransferase family 1 protein [Chloroflexi bacterium]|nr:glycosyltransferase family 1 protein [Chloroflexota bacterium]
MRVGIDYTSAATQREGIGRATRELVNALLRLPDCPDLHLVYAHRGPVPAADALGVHERVKLRRLPLSPRVMLAGWYKARLPLPVEALLGPLHVMHGPDFVLPPRVAAAGVVTVHDLAFATRPEDAHPAQRRFLESAVPWSIDRARLVVAVSETTRRDLMTRYGVRPHRIRVVPNAVSSEFHERDGAEELAEVRRRLRLPEEFLLSVGTIHPRKNLGGLARAAALSGRQLGRTLPVVHVGREGWLCERVFADIESAGSPGIRFVGQIGDATLRALYRQAAALVYPSFAEGFGLPILEAFACGTPVVTSNGSGMLEAAGDAAELVDPHDPESIAAGIVRVARDVDRRAELVERGRRRLEDFSWSRSARLMLDVYAEARRGEPSPQVSGVAAKR